ncbi:MAG: hypothetical protein EXQ94_04480 [Alphaproteobacteria bacterium]|nr:hypothetical protein [Alphaproteobacteria bacterium]
MANKRSIIAVARALNDAAALVLLGADVMDGCYGDSITEMMCDIANTGAASGVPTVLAGFIWSEKPTDGAIRNLRGLHPSVVCNLRDPVSLDRFQLKVGRPANPVADLAFLLRPRVTTTEVAAVLAWMDDVRSNGGRLVVMNVNKLATRALQGSVDQIFADVANHLLAQRGYLHLVLMYHDFRDAQKEAETIGAIHGRILAPHGHRVLKVLGATDAWCAKGVAGAADLVLTGRMHLAIAALGAGVPAVCIVYQGKFEGLMQLFALEDVILEPGRIDSVAPVLACMGRALARLDEMKATINSRLPLVRKLALKNVEFLRAIGDVRPGV